MDTLDLERKFSRLEIGATDDPMVISGYASFFGQADQGGDIVAQGAFTQSLDHARAKGQGIKMLWQHDPAQPIGVWTDIHEDDRGLFVSGRLLSGVARAAEAAELLRAGALDGLSIGYRTVKSHKNAQGARVLTQVDLWEVSLVTFPMLPTARVNAKSAPQDWERLTHLLQTATDRLAQP